MSRRSRSFKRLRFFLAVLITALMTFSLFACGSSSSSDSDDVQAQAPAVQTVSGVAATGAVMDRASVTIKDSTGAVINTTTTNSDGYYSMDVTGYSPPFLIKASNAVAVASDSTSDSTSIELYSASSGAGTANINPASNLAIALAAGTGNLSDIYENYTGSPSLTEIGNALDVLETVLDQILKAYGVAGVNPFTDPFVADGTGLDRLFDDLKIDIDSSGDVTFTNEFGADLGNTTLASFSSFSGIDFEIAGTGQDAPGLAPDYRLELNIDTSSLVNSSIKYSDDPQRKVIESNSITGVTMTANNVASIQGTAAVNGAGDFLFTLTFINDDIVTIEVEVNGVSYDSGPISLNDENFSITVESSVPVA